MPTQKPPSHAHVFFLFPCDLIKLKMHNLFTCCHVFAYVWACTPYFLLLLLLLLFTMFFFYINFVFISGFEFLPMCWQQMKSNIKFISELLVYNCYLENLSNFYYLSSISVLSAIFSRSESFCKKKLVYSISNVELVENKQKIDEIDVKHRKTRFLLWYQDDCFCPYET